MLREPAAETFGLARLFAAQGLELALVGGTIRDVFLGRHSRDREFDLATDAPPERVREITERWADTIWETGIQFGTVGLRKGGTVFEITTYRGEEYQPDSRKPLVTFGRSLEADLGRRDFTVNAIAARLPTLELVDPFGGLSDLRTKVLRTPGKPEDSFNDDALRMLRAARFAAQLGFTVVPEVQAAMTAMAGRLSIVSAERISAELTKLIRAPGPDGPVRGIAVLVDTGVAEQVLPEVPKLRLERDEHFRHKDVYQHSLTVLARAIVLEPAYGLRDDLVVRLAALLHDIGKPKTRRALPGGRVAFHHHEVVGAAMARDRLTALRFPAAVVSDTSKLIALHLRFHGYGEREWTDSAVRRYVRDAGRLLTRLHVLTRADCTTRNKAKAQRLERAYDDLEERIAALAAQEELDKIRPDLNGNEIMRTLGIKQGPLVGKAHRHLLDLRIEHGPLGHDRATQELLRWAEAEGLEVPGPPGPSGAPGPPGPADGAG
jgi:poly(A) polymerase